MEDHCWWELQKQEMLLLKSIYSREGECLVTLSSDGCSAPSVLSEDALVNSQTPSGNETAHIHVRLPSQTCDMDVEVIFLLPRGYPQCEPPTISIRSKHMTLEYLTQLAENATRHSKTLLPSACLFDIIEKIKDDILMSASDDRADSLKGHHKAQSSSDASQNRSKCCVLSKPCLGGITEF